MARRGSAAPPISLFSFQDIITSVAGIIIFLTLMMAVELVQHANDSPPVQTSKLNTELSETVSAQLEEIKRLEDRLNVGQKQLDTRIRFNRNSHP